MYTAATTRPASAATCMSIPIISTAERLLSTSNGQPSMMQAKPKPLYLLIMLPGHRYKIEYGYGASSMLIYTLSFGGGMMTNGDTCNITKPSTVWMKHSF